MLTARSFVPIAVLRCLSVLLLLGATACATRGPELAVSASAIRTSVSEVDTESQKIFADINAKAREDTITRLLLSEQRPSEDAFQDIIEAQTADAWATAFGAIQTYLGAIQNLVDDKRSGEVGSDLEAIGRTLQGPGIGASLPAGSVGLFANFGAAIIQASAEKEALAAMRVADPDLRALMSGLADLVVAPGGSQRPGTLRRMVDNYWFNKLAEAENAFGTLANPTEAARRKLLVDYGSLIDQRATERNRLARLRQALLAIGEAHSQAARGNASATFYWLNQINRYLDDARKEAEKAAKEG